MISDGLQAYLAANVGLQALLGTPNTRSDSMTGIYPLIAPEEVPLPYIVFQQVGGNSPMVMEGTSALIFSRWRFSSYGSTFRNAKKVAKALKMAMISMPLGALPGSSNAVAMGAWWMLEADDAEPIPHGTIYATHMDFEVNYIDNE